MSLPPPDLFAYHYLNLILSHTQYVFINGGTMQEGNNFLCAYKKGINAHIPSDNRQEGNLDIIFVATDECILIGLKHMFHSPLGL